MESALLYITRDPHYIRASSLGSGTTLSEIDVATSKEVEFLCDVNRDTKQSSEKATCEPATSNGITGFLADDAAINAIAHDSTSTNNLRSGAMPDEVGQCGANEDLVSTFA